MQRLSGTDSYMHTDRSREWSAFQQVVLDTTIALLKGITELCFLVGAFADCE